MLVGLDLLLAVRWLHAFLILGPRLKEQSCLGGVLHSWPRGEKSKNHTHTMQFSLRLLLRCDRCHDHSHPIGHVQHQWTEKVTPYPLHMRHCKSHGTMGVGV